MEWDNLGFTNMNQIMYIYIYIDRKFKWENYEIIYWENPTIQWAMRKIAMNRK